MRFGGDDVGGVIYLMRRNGELTEMNERGYDTEDLLQGYLADHPDLPAELRRIVEFLNDQMNPAEVLAVEIKQHVAERQEEKAFVPRLIGHTAQAQRVKAIGAGGRWNQEFFFADLEARRGVEEASVATKILEWAEMRPFYIWWGKGKNDGSFFPMLEHKGARHWLISVWTYGRLEVQFQQMKTEPFDRGSERLELLRRLNEISGVDLSADRINKRPSFPLSVLSKEAALNQFLETLDWFVREVKAT
jgi:hypothetical protein